jgi:hypothetical protein
MAQPHAEREDVHLAPGIVDVVLAVHGIPAGLEEIGQHRSDGGAASVTDMQRSGRIGRNEFDLHRLPGTGRAAPIACPGRAGLRDRVEHDLVGECEIEKPRARDLAPFDRRGSVQFDGQQCGHVTRRAAVRLGQQ